MKEKRRCSILFHLLVPGAGRQVADCNVEAELVGQRLQFAFPQPHPRAIAGTLSRGNPAAYAVGLTIPPAVLARADELIE
jgi:hypothetical protein